MIEFGATPADVRSPRYVVIGAGGLGCPALLGLQAGGARRIGIVDDDAVDLANLPRQVLYGSADVGVAKVDAARWALRERARGSEPLEITTLARRLDPAQLSGWIDEQLATTPDPIVLECSDSPRLKFAVHDACVARGVRVVVGGVVGWHGQAMAVDPGRHDAACYRCVFEAAPPRELTPACSEAGVAGAAAGTVGHAMALLAMALAENRPPESSVAGVCLHFDLLRASVRRLAPKPRSDCPTCGPNQPLEREASPHGGRRPSTGGFQGREDNLD
jgi:molybdopterin/thiamine biosynthesis adenylyltransferase